MIRVNLLTRNFCRILPWCYSQWLYVLFVYLWNIVYRCWLEKRIFFFFVSIRRTYFKSLRWLSINHDFDDITYSFWQREFAPWYLQSFSIHREDFCASKRPRTNISSQPLHADQIHEKHTDADNCYICYFKLQVIKNHSGIIFQKRTKYWISRAPDICGFFYRQAVPRN